MTMRVGLSPSVAPAGVGPSTFTCSFSSVPSHRTDTSASGALNRWMRSDPAVKCGQARRSEGAISVAADPSSPAGSAGTHTISVPGVPPSPCVR